VRAEPRVRLTSHATRRIRERLPELVADVKAAGGRLDRVVYAEISQAIVAGRMAKSTPTFMNRRKRAQASRGHTRYVWPPDESRAWIVRRKHEDGCEVWHVLTVMAPLQRRVEAA